MESYRNLSEHFEPADDAENAWESFARKQLDERDSLLIVAEVGNKIIGYCLARIQLNPPFIRIRKNGVISNLFVEEAFRRRGIGRKLFDFARKWFEQKGVEHLLVTVVHHSPVAQGFWRAMGFTDYLDALTRRI